MMIMVKIFFGGRFWGIRYTPHPGTVILLMAEILHQLRLVVFPIIYRVSAPSQVVGNGISAINSSGLNITILPVIPCEDW